MFRRFTNLFKQDFTVAMRNYFQYVIIFLSIVMIILLNFFIPEQVKLTPTELFLDKTEGKVLEEILLEHGIGKDRFYQSREDLMEEVENNSNAIGIIMEGTKDNAKFTVIHQGNENKQILNILDATLENTLSAIKGIEKRTNHRIEHLRPKADPVPFNKNMIPVMIVFDAVMLGFLLIAVMVFQEKEEGSVRAYRVSPAGTFTYIFSKTSVNVLLALIYSLLVIIFTAGLNVNYLKVILLVILASSLMTLVGLAVSVFFRSLQEFIFVGVFIIIIAGMPMASYLTPSFAPKFMTWLPSYPVLFGLREILFPTGKEGFLTSLYLMLLVENLVFLAISYWAVKRKLMKEGK